MNQKNQGSELSEKRIRLLVVSHALSGGGAERFTSTLVSHLDRERFDLSLCLMHEEIGYPLPEDVSLTVLGKEKPWHLWRSIRRLRQVIGETQPHVLLSTIAYITRITGVAIGRNRVRPHFIARIGDNPALEASGWLQLLINVWNKYTYPIVNKLVANSEGLARGIKCYYPFTENTVCTIYNPTDFTLIDQLSKQPFGLLCDPDIPVILSVGRLDKQKRPDVLLDSFAMVRSRIPAVLWICGDGPLRKQISRDIASRGLGDSVKLLGFQDNPYALMRLATLFVMTSDHEGLPNALIEAQGLGIPAVSTHCLYGPEEIIEHGKTGLLTEVGDSKSIATATEKILTDKPLLAAMGKAAKLRSRQLFDKTVLIPKWEKMLFECGNIHE
jgi:glycosyltransferase involved in cell wall biosynthesis